MNTKPFWLDGCNMRKGMSLLEMVIAMSMLLVVVGLAMNALLDTKGLAKNIDDDESLEDDIRLFKQTVGGDLANTGWFFSGTVTTPNPVPTYPQVHFSYRNSSLDVASPQPNASSLIPSLYEDGRVVGLTSTRPGILSADVLYFIKIKSSSTVSANPSMQRVDQINFKAQSSVSLDQFAAAPPALNLVFNSIPGAVFQPLVSPVWESNLNGLTWAQNAQPENLRIYRYYVVPDIATGYRTGILMKSYANAGNATVTANNNDWAWMDEGEICHDIKSLTFDTYLTDPLLAQDQIRVKAVFLREGTHVGLVKTDDSSAQFSRRERTFEGTFSLRSQP